MIMNGETISKVVPSATVAEDVIVSEAIVPASVEVNSDAVAVNFDVTIALVNRCQFIATAEGSTIEFDREKLM